MNTIDPKDRLKQIFESTIDTGIKHTGNINDLDYYSLLCKSTATNSIFSILNCNVSMFNFEFNKEDSVLMIFSIPITLSNDSKHISERIMDIIKLVEDCFITIDYMSLKNIKDDKIFYMTVIKNVKEDDIY